MDLQDDAVFKQEMDKLNLKDEHFEYFSKIFGDRAERKVDRKNVDLRKAFLLQVAIGRKSAEFNMSKNEIQQTLKDLIDYDDIKSS